jgi:hypothetical protein
MSAGLAGLTGCPLRVVVVVLAGTEPLVGRELLVGTELLLAGVVVDVGAVVVVDVVVVVVVVVVGSVMANVHRSAAVTGLHRATPPPGSGAE